MFDNDNNHNNNKLYKEFIFFQTENFHFYILFPFMKICFLPIKILTAV